MACIRFLLGYGLTLALLCASMTSIQGADPMIPLAPSASQLTVENVPILNIETELQGRGMEGMEVDRNAPPKRHTVKFAIEAVPKTEANTESVSALAGEATQPAPIDAQRKNISSVDTQGKGPKSSDRAIGNQKPNLTVTTSEPMKKNGAMATAPIGLTSLISIVMLIWFINLRSSRNMI